jgi:hypothetical protein
MSEFIFQGLVLPARAVCTTGFQGTLSYNDAEIAFHASIISNEITIFLETDALIDLWTLRNLAKELIVNRLAMVAYLKGLAYDVEITRVISRDLGVDYVFGIDISVIADRHPDIDVDSRIDQLSALTSGDIGALIRRCFNDLVSAMKNPEDCGFYCFRAIESLRVHCALRHDLDDQKDAVQWDKFRLVSSISREMFAPIERSAKLTRHGRPISVTSEQRVELFRVTFAIVDAYIKTLVDG